MSFLFWTKSIFRMIALAPIATLVVTSLSLLASVTEGTATASDPKTVPSGLKTALSWQIADEAGKNESEDGDGTDLESVWRARLEQFAAVLILLISEDITSNQAKHAAQVFEELQHQINRNDNLPCSIGAVSITSGSKKQDELRRIYGDFRSPAEQEQFSVLWLRNGRLSRIGDLEALALTATNAVERLLGALSRNCPAKKTTQWMEWWDRAPLVIPGEHWQLGMVVLVSCSRSAQAELQAIKQRMLKQRSLEAQGLQQPVHSTLLIAASSGGCRWPVRVDVDLLKTFNVVQELLDFTFVPSCTSCMKVAAMRATPYKKTLFLDAVTAGSENLNHIIEALHLFRHGNGADLILAPCTHPGWQENPPASCLMDDLIGKHCWFTGAIVYSFTDATKDLLDIWTEGVCNNHKSWDGGFFRTIQGIPDTNLPRRQAEWVATQDALPLCYLLPMDAAIEGLPGFKLSMAGPWLPPDGKNRSLATSWPPGEATKVLVVVDNTKISLSKAGALAGRHPHEEYNDFWLSDAVEKELGGPVRLFRLTQPLFYNMWKYLVLRICEELYSYAPDATTWIFETRTHDLGLEVLNMRLNFMKA